MSDRGKLILTSASPPPFRQPTNHLDIPSKEMLEEALAAFPGTVLAVSHDRYFLRKIATRVLEIADGEVTDYTGDYECALLPGPACAPARELTRPVPVCRFPSQE